MFWDAGLAVVPKKIHIRFVPTVGMPQVTSVGQAAARSNPAAVCELTFEKFGLEETHGNPA